MMICNTADGHPAAEIPKVSRVKELYLLAIAKMNIGR